MSVSVLFVAVADDEKLVAAVADINRVGKKLAGEEIEALRIGLGNCGENFRGFLKALIIKLKGGKGVACKKVLRVHNKGRAAYKGAGIYACGENGGGEKGHAYGAEVYVASAETLALPCGKGMEAVADKAAAQFFAKLSACCAGGAIGAVFVYYFTFAVKNGAVKSRAV